MKNYMKKYLCSAIALIFSTNLFAAPTAQTIPEYKVNCEKVSMFISIYENKFIVRASWDTTPKFPNPVEHIEVGNLPFSKLKKFKFSCPNYSVAYDGNVVTFKGESLDILKEKIDGYKNNIDLYNSGFYRYPNIKKDWVKAGHYQFNLDSLKVGTIFHEFEEGEDIKNNRSHYQIPKETVIGYKVDNRELKPLIHNQEVYNYLEDFKNAKVIDIYHKYSQPYISEDSVARIHINKEEPTIRIYNKYPFPQN